MIFFPLLLLVQPQTDCKDPLTQLDLNICSGREFDAADEELNGQWGRVAEHKKSSDEWAKKNGKEGGYFQKLLEAQRAGLSYRAKHCEAVSDAYRGGSIRLLIHNLCKTELTKQRTDQLQKMIEPN